MPATEEQVRKAEKHKEAILKVWRQHPDRMEIGALFTSANAILGAMDDATAESAELLVACVEFARQTAEALAGKGGDSEHRRKCMNYQDGFLEGVAGGWTLPTPKGWKAPRNATRSVSTTDCGQAGGGHSRKCKTQSRPRTPAADRVRLKTPAKGRSARCPSHSGGASVI